MYSPIVIETGNWDFPDNNLIPSGFFQDFNTDAHAFFHKSKLPKYPLAVCPETTLGIRYFHL